MLYQFKVLQTVVWFSESTLAFLLLQRREYPPAHRWAAEACASLGSPRPQQLMVHRFLRKKRRHSGKPWVPGVAGSDVAANVKPLLLCVPWEIAWALTCPCHKLGLCEHRTWVCCEVCKSLSGWCLMWIILKISITWLLLELIFEISERAPFLVG